MRRLQASRFRVIHFLVDSSVKPLTESDGKLEDTVVSHKNDDISRRIKNCRANFASLEVAIDLRAQVRVHLAIDVGGDVHPNVFAVDPHLAHPNRPLRLGAYPPSFGASSLCRSALAR